MAKELTQAVIEQWIALCNGTFSVRDIWGELNIVSPEAKQHLRVILNRLEDKKAVQKTAKDGFYRKIDVTVDEMDWQSADINNIMDIKFPFDLHNYCKIYPKSIIIIAGEKNAGKTSFLYQCVKLNMFNFQVDLFNSETGVEQMKERFEPLDIPVPAPFRAIEKYSDFSDVMDPTHLSIVDYLDFNSELYLIGDEIDRMFRKLTTGAAIIGIQKPAATTAIVRGKKVIQSRDLGYGGAFTAKRAVLYISLGMSILKVVYIKNPKVKTISYNNAQWKYKFDDNGYFTDIKRYYSDEEEDYLHDVE